MGFGWCWRWVRWKVAMKERKQQHNVSRDQTNKPNRSPPPSNESMNRWKTMKKSRKMHENRWWNAMKNLESWKFMVWNGKSLATVFLMTSIWIYLGLKEDEEKVFGEFSLFIVNEPEKNSSRKQTSNNNFFLNW